MEATKGIIDNHQAEPATDPKMTYYQTRFNLTADQLQAALRSVGNNYNLLEGFVRKNRSTLTGSHD